ncbi:MAG TPA: DUF6152 family protein [Gammaproteobacteria bacterium]|nr:DUF6152 family protein [Gammaproteobacteria bacterium]
MKGIVIAGAMLAAAVAWPAFAHHSRSNFDLDSTVEIEGVVTEFSWQNPHAFVVIEGKKDGGETRAWTFELNSTPVLKRFGWTPDTLKTGDRVLARGNPDRDANRRFLYANLFVRDGQDIWAWGGPQLTQAPAPPSPEIAAAHSTDFAGVWRIQFQGDLLGRNRPDNVLVNTLPVTAKGQAQVDAFDPDQNPEWDCAPMTFPQILGYPYPFEITRPDPDTLVIKYEVNELVRTVHLGEKTHSASVASTPLGHSIGRIEGNELVIETARFAHVRWGNGVGVDSSEQKSTVERYALAPDGKSLTLAFTMTDPEYLAKSVTVDQRYNLNAGYKLQEYLCDPATSRRHLHAGED